MPGVGWSGAEQSRRSEVTLLTSEAADRRVTYINVTGDSCIVVLTCFFLCFFLRHITIR